MGLLDQVGGALGQGKGGGTGALMQQVVGMLGRPGALNELTASFQRQGLGNVIQSWIGTGENLPISPDQLQRVMGSGMIGDLAKKAGMGETETAGALSKLLPEVVDKASPDGKEPSPNAFGGLMSSLGKLSS